MTITKTILYMVDKGSWKRLILQLVFLCYEKKDMTYLYLLFNTLDNVYNKVSNNVNCQKFMSTVLI